MITQAAAYAGNDLVGCGSVDFSHFAKDIYCLTGLDFTGIKITGEFRKSKTH
jgi:hypothetical protein